VCLSLARAGQIREGSAIQQPSEVTRLLRAWREGDDRAQEKLFTLVYAELRRLARGQLQHERKDHTLQPTALAHEAYLRLVDQDGSSWENRAQFIALAATAMRRILINYAKRRHAEKRGGRRRRVTLFEAASAFEERAEDLLALDESLRRLALFDPEKARIVELRFFGGLSVEETAELVGVSPRTVERGWRLAKAWLRKEMGAAT
jgi:RNA polymerase sigma factor (TIGR02999 family)